MSKEICCPKCKGTNVRSIDNQPLYHPTKIETTMLNVAKYDNELYMTFICHDCNPNGVPLGRTFNVVFDIVPR